MRGIVKLYEIAADRQEFQLKKIDSDGNQINVVFRMNPCANENQIQSLNEKIKNRLPIAYKEFLTYYNGARLYDYEGLDGVQLLSCDELINANKYALETFEEDWDSNLLIFGKYIGENNYLAFDTSNMEKNIVDCYFDELPCYWNIIASNFDEFLRLLIESDGSKYWLKI